ncbi:HesA/MoeB/ThiF family protein [Flaviaesturariibacter aridisoli]|uniref:ThiF family adenylyltransferase n=1 Tax=Flaviaesturariibacter aridisoli TaxID=2545761 RepID=A0A4R4DV84_9BACT|nr:ThiF family adenylyltransferase [Flaviaesturariibacter aridisoli]TCZ65034.1 ThiF family adenylyltransferase [Flaviaesturariibacter aridisoli]
MQGHRITLLKSIESRLTVWLNGHPDGHERGAILLFRRFSRPVKGFKQSDRFVAVEMIEMSDDWVLDSSRTHLTINMRMFPEVYHRCETLGLELGFVHSHPEGCLFFSERDDTNERNILHGVSGCNGKASFLVSMVLCEGKWIARARRGYNPALVIQIRHIAVIGDSLELFSSGGSALNPTLERQAAAFGAPFNRMLQSLRIAIVGLGGTGSPVATLLSRCGVGELILIDGDRLEKSNMNRVRGYNAESVGKKKAKRLKKFIDSLGLSCETICIASNLQDSPEAIDAISSADVIFGCTDDATGRDIINQCVYYYAQALIDLGIAGFVDKDQIGTAYLRDYRARVSCILPESGSCLRCQRVINDDMIKYEEEVKRRPELLLLDAETLEREFYIRGGQAGAPGVGPFTSAAADYGVATLFDLIQPFRKFPEDVLKDNIWLDFLHMSIYSNGPDDNPDCIHCRDKVLLLKAEGKYRLGYPALGEIVENA